MIVNCQQYDAGKCLAGHHGGTPTLVACRVCQHRQAIDPAQGVVLRVRGKPVVHDEVVAPVPHDQWPDWALWLEGQKADGERGVGDTIERLLGKGGKAFRAFWRATFEKVGLGCGCDGRRERMNARFAYPP